MIGKRWKLGLEGGGGGGGTGVGWASCVFVATFRGGRSRDGGDGREEVFAEYGAVLVELSEAKKWLEVGTGTGWPRGTLARVAGGGHLWWIRARARQGRRAL